MFWSASKSQHLKFESEIWSKITTVRNLRLSYYCSIIFRHIYESLVLESYFNIIFGNCKQGITCYVHVIRSNTNNTKDLLEVWNEDTWTKLMDIALMFLLLTLNWYFFTVCFDVNVLCTILFEKTATDANPQTVKSSLKKLTGKKHIFRLQKVGIWAFGWLTHQIISLYGNLKLKKKFKKI